MSSENQIGCPIISGLGVQCTPDYARYWAGLEKSWNGYLLDTVDTVIRRAGNFFWKGLRTSARLLDGVYEKGIKVCGDEKVELEQRLQRSTTLHWWDITIQPKAVNL